MVFDTSRYGFTAIGDTLLIMRPEDRHMQTKAWLEDKCELTYSDLYGYITRDRIQFFDGDYETTPDVTTDLVNAAFNAYIRLFGATYNEAIVVPVYNGVRKGEDGVQWPPVLRFDRTLNEWVIV